MEKLSSREADVEVLEEKDAKLKTNRHGQGHGR